MVRDCLFLPQAQKLVKYFRERSAIRSPSREQTKGQKSIEYRRKSRKTRDYTTDDEDDGDSVTKSEINKHADETAAILKIQISKIPISNWVADTGASTYMTDQLQLFRGPLMRIRRRTIKIGGGDLYSDYIGTVEIRVRNGENTRLAKTLYVPELKINLLSGRRLYESGLKGTQDRNGLYFHNNKKHEIIGAIRRGGVYIINRITTGLAESAFNIFICACHYISELGGRAPQVQGRNNPAPEDALPALSAPKDPSETDKDIPEKDKAEYNL